MLNRPVLTFDIINYMDDFMNDQISVYQLPMIFLLTKYFNIFSIRF